MLLLYPLAAVQMWDQAEKGKVPYTVTEIELGTENPIAAQVEITNGDEIVKDSCDTPPPSYNNTML